MKHGNLLYSFTNNKKYHTPLAIDYLIEDRKLISEKIIIIGLFSDEEYVEIPELINGKKVVAIDENAFIGHTELKHISIPKTIEHVALNAFSDSVTIRYDGMEGAVQNFIIKFKKRQREIIDNQLQGFSIIDKNKRWRKSIRIIKKSKDKMAAKQSLIEKLGLSEYQADVYLECGIMDIATISYMNIQEKIDKLYT